MRVEKILRKIFHLVGRALSGESLLEIRLSQEHWNSQFKKGYWDFLHELHPNISIIVMLCATKAQERKVRILDVGCGNGALLKNLKIAHVNFDYVGTDISEQALQKAQQFDEGTELLVRDMEEDPRLEGDFDIIIFSEVLLYGSHQKIIEMHKKYLKPDGFFVVSLYDTLRTKMIWYGLKKTFIFHYEVKVRDHRRDVAWNVRAGRLVELNNE